MISLSQIALFVFYAIVAVAVLGLLWYAIGYAEKELGGPPKAYSIIRLVFVLLVVFGLVFFLISLVSGQKVFQW